MRRILLVSLVVFLATPAVAQMPAPWPPSGVISQLATKSMTFTRTLYQDYLGREPDLDGWLSTTGPVGDTTSLVKVLSAIECSIRLVTGRDATSQEVIEAVTWTYLVADYTYNLEALAAEEHMLASAEHAECVRAIFAKVVGREPTEEEQAKYQFRKIPLPELEEEIRQDYPA